jgi:hypothetical protein
MADKRRGISSIYSGGLCILPQHAPHCNYGISPASNPWTYDGIGGNPYSIFHIDLSKNEMKRNVWIIMATREQESPLRDANVGPNFDFDEVVDPHSFTDPNMISDYQSPGMLDIDSRLDDRTATDFCPE